MSRTYTNTSRQIYQRTTRETSRATSQNDRINLDQPGGASSKPKGKGLNKVGTTGRNHNQKMSSFPGSGNSLGTHLNTDRNENVGGHTTNPQQQDRTREGNYADGYTVFPPNVSKREQIRRMAERESQDYEQYKQAIAVRHVSHTGVVGGSELTEDQVRAKQAQALRAHKFNRQQKQEQQRQAKKRAEEEEIEKMKLEARRKAELNAARKTQNVPAAEVRRKREAFLQMIENKSSPETASSSSAPTHLFRT